MRQNRTLWGVFMLSFGFMGAHAQQSPIASGGEASGNGTVSYSIGQTTYTTANGMGGTVTQGVQQPFEISEVMGLPEAIGIKLNLSVYPNPTTDRLILKSEHSEINTLTYQLFDLHGRLIAKNKLDGNETTIMMQGHEDGVYLLKITNSTKEIKTFKIIKKR